MYQIACIKLCQNESLMNPQVVDNQTNAIEWGDAMMVPILRCPAKWWPQNAPVDLVPDGWHTLTNRWSLCIKSFEF
jgi:hypothetical protein